MTLPVHQRHLGDNALAKVTCFCHRKFSPHKTFSPEKKPLLFSLPFPSSPTSHLSSPPRHLQQQDRDTIITMKIPHLVTAFLGLLLSSPVDVHARVLGGGGGGTHRCDQSFPLNVNNGCNNGNVNNWFACQNYANVSPQCASYIDSCFYDYCRNGGFINATGTNSASATSTSTSTVTINALTSTTYDATFTASV